MPCRIRSAVDLPNPRVSSFLLTRAGLQLDQSSLVNKNRELFQMYTEKNKKQQQTQHLYDTLKKRILMSQVQTAASDTVNRTVDSFASAARPETFDASALHQNEEAAPGSRLRQSPNLASNLNGGGVLHPHDRRGNDGRRSADILNMPPPDRPAAHRPRGYSLCTYALQTDGSQRRKHPHLNIGLTYQALEYPQFDPKFR